ncbi:hypothetical protein IQ249_20770 [Lusitaniella coriacea LEGE 07157]|uniref:Uncharacterized protein n=1 Tax=Lusitaniella coriacea LEGE 07157 TaxID=945747 RepID=A0A8J7JDJ9_9CYAN|nr:hypothetical protein [Lusitaniella coriacea]MBE9118330.1 hypothetical protein [Lusitaniella coriacea LEGE 07157]
MPLLTSYGYTVVAGDANQFLSFLSFEVVANCKEILTKCFLWQRNTLDLSAAIARLYDSL